MRKIKFRGKRVNNGQWIEGYYGESFREISSDIKTSYIVEMNRRPKGHDIHKETVGQFTGLTDKNGKEIYEGDIVKVVNSDNEVDPLDSDTGIGEVIFLVESGLWYISSTIHNGLFDINDSYYIEIIGNIHDNPELLK